MTKIASISPMVAPTNHGLTGWIKRHSLIAYFGLTFAITWVSLIPIILSQRGLAVMHLPDAVLLVLFLVSTFAGPLPSALIVTGVCEGRAGVKKMLRSIVQWRVGVGWYLLVLIGYPAVFLLGMSAYLGVAPLVALAQKWPLLFSYYLPTAAIGIVYPGLGEEPGWRGFALPRLQKLHGPLMASLILGVLHGTWHLPAYFVPGAIQDGPFQFAVFATNTCGIIASTVVWTWLFNSAKSSILFAMLVHGISNAVSGLFPQWLAGVGNIDDPWFVTKVMGICALLIIIFTRGKLGYSIKPEVGE
jgi:uncharacterized protein